MNPHRLQGQVPISLLGMWLFGSGKLIRRTDEYIILADGEILMSSRMHGSEEALAAGVGRRNQYCVTTFAFTKCGLRTRELTLRFSQLEWQERPKDCKRHFISPLVVSRSEN